MHPPRKPARLLAVAAVCLTLPLLATAQSPQLKLPSFPDLKEHATESVDLTLGWMPLHLVGWLMNDGDPDSAEVKKTLQGLKSVQIRSFQFSTDYSYPQAEIDQLRAQLSAPGWSPLVQVRKRGDQEGRTKENVDIYVALEDKKVKGLVIIACEPREFTVVNIVGTIDLEQIAGLRKTFVPPGKGITQVAPQA
jgi:Domain of unknown function (DUF4252)